MTSEEIYSRKVQLGRTFRPGAPINQQDLFAGRIEQVKQVINAALQPGRHAILFGERGVGKTSLAIVISSILGDATGKQLLNSGTINCDGSDTFTSLWRKVFRELTVSVETLAAGFGPPQLRQRSSTVDTFLPSRELQPDDIRYALKQISRPALIVLDEIDRLPSRHIRSLLADTIKNLSDHAVDATLILVGVADSVVDLINEHQSIERALVQVPMPRMSSEELIEIVEKGLRSASIGWETPVPHWIAKLSQGLPHYTHSLALYASFNALEHHRTHVYIDDVLAATKETVESSYLCRATFHSAVSSTQPDTLFRPLLCACALAETDELGYFPAAAIREPLSKITGRSHDVPGYARRLSDLCEMRRGAVLSRKGEPRRFRFRFSDPMMQPFVILHNYSIGVLTNTLLEESRGRMRPPDSAVETSQELTS